MNKIVIRRENNQGILLLKVLSLFRDKDLINSLQEVIELMKKFEKEDEISISCNSRSIDEIRNSLEEENANFTVI